MTNTVDHREKHTQQAIITKAVPADRQRIAEMYAIDMSDLGIDRTPEDLLEVVDQSIGEDEGSTVSWVVRVETGDIAGVMMAAPFWSLKMGGQGLWIEGLYVSPDFRRRGLAQKLVAFLIEWAEKEGYKGLELEAYHMNTAASCLYRAEGFRRLARERYCFHFGIDD
jgi:GNAT superfamily N-acetyltransferase